MTAEEQHRLRESLRNFKQLLAMQPRHVALLGKVALACERLGRLNEAADTLVERAEILVEEGDDHAAAADCEHALELVPQHKRGRALRARLESVALLGLGERNDTIEADAHGVVDASQLLAVREPEELGLVTAPPSIAPEAVLPEGDEPIDAALLLAVHDADEVVLTVDPPTMPPEDLVEINEDDETPDLDAFTLDGLDEDETHDHLERAVTSKLPQVAPLKSWVRPRLVAGQEAGPVSVDVDLFTTLPRHVFARLLTDAQRISVDAGACVIAEGEEAHSLVLVTQGRARVQRRIDHGDEVLGHVGEDDVVGLIEKLRGTRWRMTVVAETPMEMRAIDHAAVGDLRARFPGFDRALRAEAERQELLLLLATSPLFSPLSPGAREALARRWRARTVLANETLVPEGSRIEGLYLVATGRLGMYHDTTRIGVLAAGDCAGVLAAVGEGRAHVTLTGEARSDVFFLEWDGVADLLAEPEVCEAFERVASLRRLQA